MKCCTDGDARYSVELQSTVRLHQIQALPYIQNRPVAVRAPRTKQVVVVRLAVRIAVPLEEVARAQLLRAVVARKVLRMPGLAQGRNDLADDRLVARVAASLLGRVHTLAAHVGLQIPKHRVQLVVRRRQLLGRRNRGQRALVVRDTLVRLRVIRHRRLELLRSGGDL